VDPDVAGGLLPGDFGDCDLRGKAELGTYQHDPHRGPRFGQRKPVVLRVREQQRQLDRVHRRREQLQRQLGTERWIQRELLGCSLEHL
jgi:hypothetical protein